MAGIVPSRGPILEVAMVGSTKYSTLLEAIEIADLRKIHSKEVRESETATDPLQ